VEDFRHHLNNMKATGDTAVWDSIALAMDQLQQYASKYPKSKLRIICISDGEDNKSNRLVHELAAQLGGHNIVVDSFCLGRLHSVDYCESTNWSCTGDANNTALQTLSYMTGGYKFEPASLEEAMAICEMEPVFSVLERPAAVVPRFSSRHAGNALWRFQQARKSITVDRATRDDFPQRKSHPQLAGSFVELTSFARHASSQARADSNLRLSRIHTEIRNCGALGHPHYDIYICEENFGFWKIVMQGMYVGRIDQASDWHMPGPPESTYAGGTFLLYVEMGEDYPMSPPKARFVTSVYHPNINRHGRICHSILDRNWTVDTTTKNLIDTIYSLLLVPEFSDPINTVVTLNYHWDEVQFKEEAQSHIRKYATKTRAEWRAEITS
jgi:ubiquitin-protein ligase